MLYTTYKARALYDVSCREPTKFARNIFRICTPIVSSIYVTNTLTIFYIYYVKQFTTYSPQYSSFRYQSLQLRKFQHIIIIIINTLNTVRVSPQACIYEIFWYYYVFSFIIIALITKLCYDRNVCAGEMCIIN